MADSDCPFASQVESLINNSSSSGIQELLDLPENVRESEGAARAIISTGFFGESCQEDEQRNLLNNFKFLKNNLLPEVIDISVEELVKWFKSNEGGSSETESVKQLIEVCKGVHGEPLLRFIKEEENDERKVRVLISLRGWIVGILFWSFD